MSKLLLVCVVAASLSLPVEAQTPQTPPLSPAALHELLDWLSRHDDAKMEPEKIKLALRSLEAALQSTDDHVFSSAAWDVVKGNTRNLPEAELLKILLPAVRKFLGGPIEPNVAPLLCRLLESVTIRFGPKAKELLPDLLKVVRDDTVSAFERRYAIDAAARIGPMDGEVVHAFIDVLKKNPNPKDELHGSAYGVHYRIVERLGDMGKAAWPAKKAIEGVFHRGEAYHDRVFHSLGKLALDETPRPLADYLKRMKQIDKLPMEQVAAAFLHVQRMCDMEPTAPAISLTPRGIDGGLLWFYQQQQKQKWAERARPVLYQVVERRLKVDVYTRAALDTLYIIGPGSSPEGAMILVHAITSVSYQDYRFDTVGQALTRFETKDKEAIAPLSEGLARLYDVSEYQPTHRRIIIEVLGRFGKDAKPALPILLKTLEQLEKDAHHTSEIEACVFTLAAMERDAPEGRTLLIRLADANGPFLKKVSGTNREEVRDNLMVALSPMGLPKEGKERAQLLEIVLAGLKSEDPSYHTAAALNVQRNAADLAQREADDLVPQLARVVTQNDFWLWGGPQRNGSCGRRLPADVSHLYGQGMAIKALGALGPKARKALPQLEAFAARDLRTTNTLSYSSRVTWGPIHSAIVEARKAVPLVR